MNLSQSPLLNLNSASPTNGSPLSNITNNISNPTPSNESGSNRNSLLSIKRSARAKSKLDSRNFKFPILSNWSKEECSEARANRRICLLRKREQMAGNKENLPPARPLRSSLTEAGSLSSDESVANSGWSYFHLFLQFILII